MKKSTKKEHRLFKLVLAINAGFTFGAQLIALNIDVRAQT
jgi:hypothetical protein